MSSSFRPSSQHKPMLVKTPAFGTGIVSERRADGINVVKLPWGTVYLDQSNLGTVVSSQYKRNRYDEQEQSDDVEQQSAVRRKADEHHSRQQQPQQQQPPFQFQFTAQPQHSSFPSSTYPPFQFQFDSPAPMLS